MIARSIPLVGPVVFLVCITSAFAQSHLYRWLEQYEETNCLAHRIPAPRGYDRDSVSTGSFAEWFRNLPLKPGRPPVYFYDGRRKPNQLAHFAVIDIDVGRRDLQQCADAVIRLRAEYLYSLGRYDAIGFKFTSGDEAKYKSWIAGYRPVVEGNNVRWEKTARVDSSYAGFRKYLNAVFLYAGTISLARDLSKVRDSCEMKTGDVFVEGGSPGHAVIVVDMARQQTTGRKVFLLAQSYMPAQQMHILKNPSDTSLSPWYDLDYGDTLHTPEWNFKDVIRRRFR